MKIACLGAGGLYFTRPLGDIAVCEDLHGSDVALYDIDADRARLMADRARRFVFDAQLRLHAVGHDGEAETEPHKAEELRQPRKDQVAFPVHGAPHGIVIGW